VDARWVGNDGSPPRKLAVNRPATRGKTLVIYPAEPSKHQRPPAPRCCARARRFAFRVVKPGDERSQLVRRPERAARASAPSVPASHRRARALRAGARRQPRHGHSHRPLIARRVLRRSQPAGSRQQPASDSQQPADRHPRRSCARSCGRSRGCLYGGSRDGASLSMAVPQTRGRLLHLRQVERQRVRQHRVGGEPHCRMGGYRGRAVGRPLDRRWAAWRLSR
jgi:hypothetical protein